MGKYDRLTMLKKTRARRAHTCSKCGDTISIDADYYNEHIQDRFLHSLHARKFCAQCFQKHGESLLKKGS
jgi:hypothetical protein